MNQGSVQIANEMLPNRKVLYQEYREDNHSEIVFISGNPTSSSSEIAHWHFKAGMNLSNQIARKDNLRERLRAKLDSKKNSKPTDMPPPRDRCVFFIKGK